MSGDQTKFTFNVTRKNKRDLDKRPQIKVTFTFAIPPFFILVHKASWIVPAKVVISPNVLNVFVALDQNSCFPFHQRRYSLNSAFRCFKFHLSFPVQSGSKEPPILIALLTIYLPQCCVTSTLCIFWWYGFPQQSKWKFFPFHFTKRKWIRLYIGCIRFSD